MTRSCVLVVDDDFDLRESLADALRDEGYDVATAGNGQEALDLLARGPAPCLILLDLMMPVMDGWEFCRRQQEEPRLAAVPVCVVSAVAANSTPPTAKCVVPKPVNLGELFETIAGYCSC